MTRCALNHDAAFLPQVTLCVPCAPETTEWCCWPARVWRSWKHILITDGMRSRHIIMVALPQDTYIFFSCVLHLRGDTRWSKPLQLGSIPNHIYLLSCSQSQAGPSHWAKQGVRMQHRSLPATRRNVCWFYSTNQSNLPPHLTYQWFCLEKWGRCFAPAECHWCGVGCTSAAWLQHVWQTRNIMLQFTEKKGGRLTRWIDFSSLHNQYLFVVVVLHFRGASWHPAFVLFHSTAS